VVQTIVCRSGKRNGCHEAQQREAGSAAELRRNDTCSTHFHT
jgi:hypothetical protein